MSLNYGSITQPPKQTYIFGSNKPDKKKENTSLVSFARIFIVIAEIGLTLLPGIGTASQVGIGLAAASANTALSATSGSLSAVGVGIDFASAFIPAISDLRFVRKVDRVITSDLTKSLQSTVLKETQLAGESSAFKNLQKGLSSAKRPLTKATKLQKQYMREAKSLSSKIAKGELSNEQKAAVEIGNIEQEYVGQGQIAMDKQAEAMAKYNADLDKTYAEIRKMREIFENIKDLKFAQKINKSKFIDELEKLGGKDRLSILKELYIAPLKKKGAKALAQAGLSSAQMGSRIKIFNVMNQLSEDSQIIINNFMRKLNYVNLTKKEVSEEVELMIDVIKNVSKKDFNVLAKLDQNEFKQSFNIFGRNADPNATRKWIKKLGSRDFNDKVVQKAQLIDPNDIGRFPIEWAYQKLKDKFERYLSEKTIAAAAKEGKRLIRSSKSLDEAFFKAGGKLVGKSEKGGNGIIASRYILGIRKMPGGEPTRRAVLVKFNKLNTKSRKGNNIDGKRDIMVTMTDLDFDRLQTEGTSYWFSVGRKKGWFVSRGGRRIASSAATVSNAMSLFLGFVPIPALRNLLSIVSNWVENIADMTKGTYFKDWWPKFERAFTRSAVNRSARLATRVVIGGSAVKYIAGKAGKAVAAETLAMSEQLEMEASHPEFQSMIREAVNKAGRKSQWIGRELQRFATSTLSTFEGKTKSGMFTFTDGSSKSGSGLHNLGKKLLLTAAPTSVKGSLTRYGSRTGSNRGRALVGARRNFSQIGRIYGAVTPSGIVKPLRSITKIG